MNKASASRIAVTGCMVLFAAISCGCVPHLSGSVVERQFTISGERVQPGDVLHLDTTFLWVTGLKLTALAPMHVSWRISIRHLGKDSSLLPSEAALLQMALVTRRVDANTPTDLSQETMDFINHHQIALWDALVDSMVVRADSPSTDHTSIGFLQLNVDEFCPNLRKAIVLYEGGRPVDDEIIEFGKEALATNFGNSGTNFNCLHPNGSTFRSEIIYFNQLALEDYLQQSPASFVTPGFYPTSPKVSEEHAIIVERAAVRFKSRAGDERLWSLREWQESGICQDIMGHALQIRSVRLAHGTVRIGSDAEHNAEILQIGQKRGFYASGQRGSTSPVPLDPKKFWGRIVIDQASLNALYPADVVSIDWQPRRDKISPEVKRACWINPSTEESR